MIYKLKHLPLYSTRIDLKKKIGNTFSYKCNYKGFTLIELVIVIVLLGFLSAVAVPKIGNLIKISRIKATQGEMMVLQEAIASSGQITGSGVISGAGYKHDVGAPPNSLQDLIIKPAAVAAWNKYIQKGWNGPYLLDDNTDNYKYDSWDMEYVLNDTAIISYGPDMQLGGGDDIIIKF